MTRPRTGWLLPLLCASIVVLESGGASSAGEMRPMPRDEGTGVTVHLGGPTTIPAGRRVETLVVVGDDARVDGTVADGLVVIGGKARIDGTVLGNVLVIRGGLTLGPTSRIGGDVSLLRSSLERADGSVVRGTIHEGPSPWRNRPLRLLLWVVFSAAIVLTGLLFVLLAGDTIEAGSQTLVRDGPVSALVAVAFWICAPIAVAATVMTVVGIPLAAVVALFVLPVLWFAGYVSTGVAIGTLVARSWTVKGRSISRNVGLALGLTMLQLLLLIPYLGPGLALVAGYLGTGALVCNAWRRRRSSSAAEPRLAGPVEGAPPVLSAPGGAPSPSHA